MFGVLVCLIAGERSASACGPLEYFGRVKSISDRVDERPGIMTAAGGERPVMRMTISADGRTVETVIYDNNPPFAIVITSTGEYENGRLVRAVQKRGGDVHSTTTCAYDSQGRLIEHVTDSKGEFSTHEKVEYGQNVINRRRRAFGSWSLTTETLDERGRVVKAVEVSENRPTVEQTIEYVYTDNREEVCVVGRPFNRRECDTIVRDARGNEVESRGGNRTKLTSYEYDAAGNWIQKRELINWSGPNPHSLEQIIKRTIEYW
ncbi:MAG: hypothetical protein K2Y23_26015 [Cyanobacteria bacterium]|nr:hypothetical protein [Cyanobacteriota bacterium]